MKASLPHGSQQETNSGILAAKTDMSLVLLLAGCLLVGFSMGRWLAPLAAWIGPALILRFVRDHKVGRGFLFILAAYFLAFLIGFGSSWAGLLPLPIVPILALTFGLLWCLPFLADRLLAPRLQGLASTLVYPLAATTLEFVLIRANPFGAWGATGFTQYGDLPLMQLASVTGMIGITFLMGWFASVANWAWENRSQGAAVLRGLGVFGTVLASVFIFGVLRLNLVPASETVRVVGITPQSGMVLWNRFVADREAARLEVQSHWDAYFRETVREAQAGAQVIVWPEGAGTVPFSDEAFFISQAQEIARQYEIYLAIGIYAFNDGRGPRQPGENKFLLIDPTGTIAIEHFKYGGRIVDPGRVQGDGRLQTADTPLGVVSGVVCWDLDYPTVIQQAGQKGVGLIFVPSNDWPAIDPVHSQMAAFPAIENGMTVVRQTSDGLSIAFDPYGRVLAQTDFFTATDRTMVAQVPVRHVATLYAAVGRWLEWLLLVGFLYVIARALFAPRQIG